MRAHHECATLAICVCSAALAGSIPSLGPWEALEMRRAQRRAASKRRLLSVELLKTLALVRQAARRTNAAAWRRRRALLLLLRRTRHARRPLLLLRLLMVRLGSSWRQLTRRRGRRCTRLCSHLGSWGSREGIRICRACRCGRRWALRRRDNVRGSQALFSLVPGRLVARGGIRPRVGQGSRSERACSGSHDGDEEEARAWGAAPRVRGEGW